MRFFFLLLLLLPGPLWLRAQSVSGTVVDKSTGLPLPGVRIVDGNGLLVRSDAKGGFTVSGKGGDAFQFSAPGYASQQRKAPAYIGSVPWKVELALLSVSLKEVQVRPYNTPYQRDSFERATTYRRALVRQKSGVMSPVSMLTERVLPRQRRLFKFQEEFHRTEQAFFIDSRYTPELAAEMTRLSGDALARFMNANPMPEDFARAATDLEIKMWIRDRFKSWKDTPAAQQANPDAGT